MVTSGGGGGGGGGGGLCNYVYILRSVYCNLLCCMIIAGNFYSSHYMLMYVYFCSTKYAINTA